MMLMPRVRSTGSINSSRHILSLEFCFCCFLLGLCRIKRSQVMSIGKNWPQSTQFWLGIFFLGHPVFANKKISKSCEQIRCEFSFEKLNLVNPNAATSENVKFRRKSHLSPIQKGRCAQNEPKLKTISKWNKN